MTISPRFYRVAALASFASVASTLALIFLPLLFAPGDGFEQRMARVHEPAYQWRAWIYLAHPFVTFSAALAVALRLRATAPVHALVAALGFHAWALTEALQQCLTLFAFDRWRAAWPTADEAVRASIRASVPMYDGLWDAMYCLLLVGFFVGNLALGLVMSRGAGLTRTVGAFYLAAAALTITNLLPELGGPALPGALGFWLYPLVQPLARALIGVWLWRHADERHAPR